jgi:hypothetical protein
MTWIFIEAATALVIGLGIVWWTTRALRRRDRDDESR